MKASLRPFDPEHARLMKRYRRARGGERLKRWGELNEYVNGCLKAAPRRSRGRRRRT